MCVFILFLPSSLIIAQLQSIFIVQLTMDDASSENNVNFKNIVWFIKAIITININSLLIIGKVPVSKEKNSKFQSTISNSKKSQMGFQENL